MPKLNLSRLIQYVDHQSENKNETKFNLSNNLLTFLQKEDQDIAIIKTALVQAYEKNLQIENVSNKQGWTGKLTWDHGNLWRSDIDKLDLKFDHSHIATLSRVKYDSVPPPTASWYRSQNLHGILYDLFQQTSQFELESELEAVENNISKNANFIFKLNLTELNSYVDHHKQGMDMNKYGLSNNLLQLLKQNNLDFNLLKKILVDAYQKNLAIEEKKSHLSLSQKLIPHNKLWHQASDEHTTFDLDKLKNLDNTQDALSIPSSLDHKSWYQSQTLHKIVYELYQQVLGFEQAYYKANLEFEYQAKLKLEYKIINEFIEMAEQSSVRRLA